MKDPLKITKEWLNKELTYEELIQFCAEKVAELNNLEDYVEVLKKDVKRASDLLAVHLPEDNSIKWPAPEGEA